MPSPNASSRQSTKRWPAQIKRRSREAAPSIEGVGFCSLVSNVLGIDEKRAADHAHLYLGRYALRSSGRSLETAS